jgi:hypothetical protein
MLTVEGNEDSPSLTITRASGSSWTTSDTSDVVHSLQKIISHVVFMWRLPTESGGYRHEWDHLSLWPGTSLGNRPMPTRGGSMKRK